ncbi:MAG: hypothetical protein J0G32_01075 [Alphaproteobacteria bacterium]|nr:hypothetical protein [Alphaproteobacteria bacterium]OJV13210.1 MAG: hypothetical protein BGO27_00195 [Alphaproteobacteria bacterium 33-17]
MKTYNYLKYSNYSIKTLRKVIYPKFLKACKKGNIDYIKELFDTCYKTNRNWLLEHNNSEAFQYLLKHPEGKHWDIAKHIIREIYHESKQLTLINCAPIFLEYLKINQNLHAVKFYLENINKSKLNKIVLFHLNSIIKSTQHIEPLAMLVKYFGNTEFLDSFENSEHDKEYLQNIFKYKRKFIEFGVTYSEKIGIDIISIVDGLYKFSFKPDASVEEIKHHLKEGLELCEKTLINFTPVLKKYSEISGFKVVKFDAFKEIAKLYTQLNSEQEYTILNDNISPLSVLPEQPKEIIFRHLAGAANTNSWMDIATNQNALLAKHK